MKIIQKIGLLFITTLSVISCDKHDFEPGTEFSSAEIFSPSGGITGADDSTIRFQVNSFVSLADVSRGVKSRQWTIDKENKFLKSDFELKDTLNLNPSIDKSKGVNSNDSNVFVLLKKVGENTINYKGVFNDYTAIKTILSSQGEILRTGVDAVEQDNGQWLLDVDLKYTVLDSLKPEVTISDSKGVEIGKLLHNQYPSRNDSSNFEVLEIDLGSALHFKDNTTIGFLTGTSGPGNEANTSREWNFEGGVPATSKSIEENVVFSEVGDYIIDITVNRASAGATLKATSSKRALPYIFRVQRSTEPLTPQDAPMAFDDNDPEVGTTKITFPVNGEINEITDSAASKFTVDVTTLTNISLAINVSTVEIDPDNSSAIILTLENPIYNTDTVKLSYTGSALPITSADIKTVNLRGLEPISDLLVTPYNINFLKAESNPSFEQSSESERDALTSGGGLWLPGNSLTNMKNTDTNETLYIARSILKAKDGDASLRLYAPIPMPNTSVISFSHRLLGASNIPAGTYRLSFDIFIDDSNGAKGLEALLIAVKGTNVDSPINVPLVNSENEQPTGTWYTVTAFDFTASNAITGNLVMNLRNADNTDVNGVVDCYIDNIEIRTVEER